MAYSLSFSLYTTAGLADLRAQLIDTSGASVGAAISTGFVEVGTNGMYLWTGSIPDSHTGGAKFYSLAASSNILGLVAITPFEAENNDAKAAAIVDQVWDELLTGATHNVASSAGRRLRTLSASTIRDATAQGGTSNSITLDSGASATDEIYDNNLIVIADGTGTGQSRVIVEYNGTTKVAIVDRVWEVNPDATSEFEIIADHQSSITHHGLAQSATSNSITLSTTASSQDDIYDDDLIVISTNAGNGQSRIITDYNGTTKVATVAPDWLVNPDSGSVYVILPGGRTITQDFSTTALASLNTEVDTALGDYDAPTKAELDSGLALLATAANLTTVANGVASILDDTGTSGVVISTSVMQSLADVILGRSVATVEGTASTHSLAEVILGLLESTTAGTVWTIKKTDGSTTFNTRTLTLDSAALPVTGVA